MPEAGQAAMPRLSDDDVFELSVECLDLDWQSLSPTLPGLPGLPDDRMDHLNARGRMSGRKPSHSHSMGNLCALDDVPEGDTVASSNLPSLGLNGRYAGVFTSARSAIPRVQSVGAIDEMARHSMGASMSQNESLDSMDITEESEAPAPGKRGSLTKNIHKAHAKGLKRSRSSMGPRAWSHDDLSSMETRVPECMEFECSYCGTRKISMSTGKDGHVRIRCECGGKHGDSKPRMHAKWKLVSGGDHRHRHMKEGHLKSPPLPQRQLGGSPSHSSSEMDGSSTTGPPFSHSSGVEESQRTPPGYLALPHAQMGAMDATPGIVPISGSVDVEPLNGGGLGSMDVLPEESEECTDMWPVTP